jgi:hypothetical protein
MEEAEENRKEKAEEKKTEGPRPGGDFVAPCKKQYAQQNVIFYYE